jgi:hypothetical protein
MCLRRQRPASRRAQAVTVLLASLIPIALSGCGMGTAPRTQASPTSAESQYVPEPLTPQQLRVEEGAHLIVADGCAACHLARATRDAGPSFANFAGHRVTLTDGLRVLVDERFLREALFHPGRYEIKGYGPGPMLIALRHLHLDSRQVAALTAFIEQIGPEPE